MKGRGWIYAIKELSPFAKHLLVWTRNTKTMFSENELTNGLGDMYFTCKKIIESNGFSWGKGESYMIALENFTTGKAYLLNQKSY